MDANGLISLLKDNKQRRNEKVRHLGLDHQPVIHELMVSEKLELEARLASEGCPDKQHDIVIDTVIRSMCGWDDAGDITQDHIDALKDVYSSEIIIELYRCIVDFGYLGEQGIATAKKN